MVASEPPPTWEYLWVNRDCYTTRRELGDVRGCGVAYPYTVVVVRDGIVEHLCVGQNWRGSG